MTPEERTFHINEFRALYNDSLAPVGFQAPAPVAGERVGEYRRRAMQTFADSLLPRNNQWAKLDYATLPFEAFKNFEPMVLKACAVEAVNPRNVPPGEMKLVPVRDNQTGRVKMNTWIGQQSFVTQMGRPGRRVVRTCCPVDHAGRSCESLTIGRR